MRLTLTNFHEYKVNNAGVLENDRVITSEGYAAFV